jgi:prepilin-type N-terminal cleavage/methylation domain-containing protein
MKYIFSQEKGLSLAELLAALAVSSIIIGIAYTGLISSIMVFDKVTAETNLRNELNYVLTTLNKTLLNVDRVEIVPGFGNNEQFTKFKAIEVVKDVNGNETLYETLIELNGNSESGIDLIVNGERMNDDRYSLDGSYFSLIDGDLEVYLSIKKESSPIKPLFTYTIYTLE